LLPNSAGKFFFNAPGTGFVGRNRDRLQTLIALLPPVG
jgi:hypothetical protein